MTLTRPTKVTNIQEAFFWTSIIVFAELVAFYVIQKNVDDNQAKLFSSRFVVACLLFGLVVPYSFQKVLSGGTNVPLANLYWIVFSQLGSILLGSLLLNQNIKSKDWFAVVLLIGAGAVSVYGPK